MFGSSTAPKRNDSFTKYILSPEHAFHHLKALTLRSRFPGSLSMLSSEVWRKLLILSPLHQNLQTLSQFFLGGRWQMMRQKDKYLNSEECCPGLTHWTQWMIDYCWIWILFWNLGSQSWVGLPQYVMVYPPPRNSYLWHRNWITSNVIKSMGLATDLGMTSIIPFMPREAEIAEGQTTQTYASKVT
jgi:hypothetical protein